MTTSDIIKTLRLYAADTPLHDRTRALMYQAADRLEHAYLIIEDCSDGRRRHLDELDEAGDVQETQQDAILEGGASGASQDKGRNGQSACVEPAPYPAGANIEAANMRSCAYYSHRM